MSLPTVLDELGSDLSRSRESRQKDAQGELGETCSAVAREKKVTMSSRPKMALSGDRQAILACAGAGGRIGEWWWSEETRPAVKHPEEDRKRNELRTEA